MRLSVRAGLSGVAAAVVALGVAEVVAVLTGPLSAPLLAVGGVVVDKVPGPVKDVGVEIFGVHDKDALITGTAVLLVLYAYGVGVVARKRWRAGLCGIAVFAAVGVAAAVTRHDATVVAALPSLVGAGIAIPVLRYLLEAAGVGIAEEPVPVDEAATALAPVGAAGSKTAGSKTAGSKTAGSKTTEAGVTSNASGPQRANGLAADGAGAAEVGPDGASVEPVDPYPPKPYKPVSRQLLNYDEGRRRFLKALSIVVGVGLISGVAGRLLTSRQAVTKARSEVTLPEPVEPAPTLPAGVQADGATPYVSSNDDFYRIDTALYPPQVDPSTWQLKIHGMVRNPITITWAELLQRPMVARYVTLTCVSNEVGDNLIGNALWLGTPIKALLDEADPLPGADQVVQRSVDGWTCGSPTAVLRDGRDALLAVGMNGQPLPIEHGFPVRMVVPGLYGYVSACKWITEIELTRFSDFDAYWVPRGWSQQAPIKTESRIDTPRDGASRKSGEIVVAGVAWSQHVGIGKVEVQIDNGPWQEATLAATVSSDTWREWSYRWSATAGQHAVRVRATDANGTTQTSQQADPAPDGATGWHTIGVQVT